MCRKLCITTALWLQHSSGLPWRRLKWESPRAERGQLWHGWSAVPNRLDGLGRQAWESRVPGEQPVCLGVNGTGGEGKLCGSSQGPGLHSRSSPSLSPCSHPTRPTAAALPQGTLPGAGHSQGRLQRCSHVASSVLSPPGRIAGPCPSLCLPPTLEPIPGAGAAHPWRWLIYCDGGIWFESNKKEGLLPSRWCGF